MKTFHRLMYENLTPEEYKELCRVPARYMKTLHIDHENLQPSYALDVSFMWVGLRTWEYWRCIFDRLIAQERQGGKK
jgi:hypothetical protein